MAFEFLDGVGQTSYDAQPSPGSPGDPIFANDPEVKSESYLNPNQAIPFGRMLGKIVGIDGQADLPTSATPQFVGVARRYLGTVDGLYDTSSEMSVISFGGVWVTTEENVSADDPVYVRINGKSQVQTLTASANFVTSNVISGNVVYTNLAGLTTTTAISVTFTTSDANTSTLLAAAIAATPGVLTATVTATDQITVTMATKGESIDLSGLVVTLGASRPTLAIVQTVNPVPMTSCGSFGNTADSGTATLMTQCRYLTSTNAYPNNVDNVAQLDIISPLNS